eukprot:tig00000219_g19472.t1
MWALAALETLAPSLVFAAALCVAAGQSCGGLGGPAPGGGSSSQGVRLTEGAELRLAPGGPLDFSGATSFTFELWLALRKGPSIAGRGPAWLLRAGRAGGGGGGAEAEAQLGFGIEAAERRDDRETRDDRRADGAAWRLAQAGRPSVSASAPISDTWTHWAGTYDSRANERKLYRSSAAVGSAAGALRVPPADGPPGDLVLRAPEGYAVDVDDIRVWMGVAVPRETLASFADRPLSAEHPYLSALSAYFTFDNVSDAWADRSACGGRAVVPGGYALVAGRPASTPPSSSSSSSSGSSLPRWGLGVIGTGFVVIAAVSSIGFGYLQRRFCPQRGGLAAALAARRGLDPGPRMRTFTLIVIDEGEGGRQAPRVDPAQFPRVTRPAGPAEGHPWDDPCAICIEEYVEARTPYPPVGSEAGKQSNSLSNKVGRM